MFSSSDVTRLTTTIGSRYFFHENFYLLGEMQIAHHEINRHSNGGFLSKPVPHGTLNEGYLQVGLGVSVGEFWKTQKSEPIKELDTPVTKPVERKEEIVQKPDPDVRNYQEIISEIKKIAQENNLELRSRNGKLTIIFLNDALFDSGSDKINPKGEKSVINLAKIINKFEGIKFTIEGHTDNVPIRTLNKYANNEELSLARADAVKYILISEGVSESRLDTKGLGDTHPYKSNNTPEGRQANRRIEIVADKDISEIPELKGLVDK